MAKAYTDNLAAEVAQTVAEALAEMDDNKPDKSSAREVSILVNGWAHTAESGEGGETAGGSFAPNCPYRYLLAIEGLTSRDRANVTISPDSAETAVSCGLIPVCLAQDGFLVLAAERQPSADMSAEIWVEMGK